MLRMKQLRCLCPWRAPVARQATGSLQHSVIGSEHVFCDPMLGFAQYKPISHNQETRYMAAPKKHNQNVSMQFFSTCLHRYRSPFRNNFVQSRLQQGRSNLVDPAEWPKIGLLNRDFGCFLSVFPRKQQNTKFTKFSSVRTPEIY